MSYKTLIYDTAITGHHSEYIGNLIDYLNDENCRKKEYIFVVHPEFASLFPDIYEKGKITPSVTWAPIQDFELKKIEEGNAILASIRSMDVMSAYAKKFDINHVVALDFHTIKYGAIFKKVSYELTSIIFLQFYRLKRKTLKQKIEFYKRYWVTKLCVRNPKLSRVFVLNDQETVDYMNKEFHTNCFKMLPDPIPQLEELESFDIYEHYGIEPNREIYLHIGALGGRKGTEEVIDSAHYLDTFIQKKTAILLVGKAGNEDDIALFDDKIEEVKRKTEVQIIWDNQFVPSKMMKSIFNQCNTVLLPYKNAEFSSGILGHAAAANKRVIATNAGLLRELVLKYNLGELLDVPDAFHIAKKISEKNDEKIEEEGRRKFVENHSPKMFAGLILKS